MGLVTWEWREMKRFFFFFSFLNLNFYFRLLPGGWRPTHVTDHRTPWPCSVYFPKVQNPRAGEAEGGGSRRGRARRLVGCGKLYHQPPALGSAAGPAPAPQLGGSDLSFSLLGLLANPLFTPRLLSPPVAWRVLSALGFSLCRPPLSLPVLSSYSVTLDSR